MKHSVFALAFASLFAVLPARADNISIFGDAAFSNLIFAIPGQPPTANLGVVEGVETSFIYNTTSQQISNMNFNSNGPLGPFAFLGINQVQTNELNFDWISSMAELVLNVPIVPDASNPVTGLGTKNLGMACLTQACNDDFGGSYNFLDDQSRTVFTWLSSSPSNPSMPTPEPPSLILLGIGTLSLLFMVRKLPVFQDDKRHRQ